MTMVMILLKYRNPQWTYILQSIVRNLPRLADKSWHCQEDRLGEWLKSEVL